MSPSTHLGEGFMVVAAASLENAGAVSPFLPSSAKLQLGMAGRGEGFFSPPPFTGSFLPTSVQLDLTTQATREMAWVLSVQGQGMCVGVGVGEWILL